MGRSIEIGFEALIQIGLGAFYDFCAQQSLRAEKLAFLLVQCANLSLRALKTFSAFRFSNLSVRDRKRLSILDLTQTTTSIFEFIVGGS